MPKSSIMATTPGHARHRSSRRQEPTKLETILKNSWRKFIINSVNSVDDIINQSYKNELKNEKVKEFHDIFMKHKWDIGITNIVKHEIQTNSKPIVINPRRQPYHLIEKN